MKFEIDLSEFKELEIDQSSQELLLRLCNFLFQNNDNFIQAYSSSGPMAGITFYYPYYRLQIATEDSPPPSLYRKNGQLFLHKSLIPALCKCLKFVAALDLFDEKYHANLEK